MSLDKAIEHGKEKRKPYYGSKAIDPTCRNHGGCPWCEENRKHKFRLRSMKEETMEQIPNDPLIDSAIRTGYPWWMLGEEDEYDDED